LILIRFKFSLKPEASCSLPLVTLLSFAMSQFTCPSFKTLVLIMGYSITIELIFSGFPPKLKSSNLNSSLLNCRSVSISKSPNPFILRSCITKLALGKAVNRLRLKSPNSTVALTFLLISILANLINFPLNMIGTTNIRITKLKRIIASHLKNFLRYFMGFDF